MRAAALRSSDGRRPAAAVRCAYRARRRRSPKGDAMSLPTFLRQRLMQLSGMIAVIAFHAAGLLMSAVVIASVGHQIPLVKLVKEDKALLVLVHIVVDPHLVARHKLIHVLMPSLGELDIVDASD